MTDIKHVISKIEEYLQSRDQIISTDQNREYYSLLRQYINWYQEFNSSSDQKSIIPQETNAQRLEEIAKHAILDLGGVSEPCVESLKDYRSNLYGPYLGISDEGSAVNTIVRAALDSPKVQYIDELSPINIGVAHDAEILASTGEAVVGPEEYSVIRSGTLGRILTSTNVGARVNLKYYKSYPIISINNFKDPNVLKNTLAKIREKVKPFWITPNKIPRPFKILISFKQGIPFAYRKVILEALLNKMNDGSICDPKYHSIGLIAFVRGSSPGVNSAKRYIDLAVEAGLSELTISGNFRKQAEDRISLPGLLNYFSEVHSLEILSYEKKKGIRISIRNQIDPDTVARHLWCGLQIAKSMGFELGKYGMIPLTIEESDIVMGKIQSWFPNWTAAPVLYIDYPIVSIDTVYYKDTLIDGVIKWLTIAHNHKIPVVLIDTVEKARGNRLLKSNDEDSIGVFTLKELIEIQDIAKRMNINVLWAGGITIDQVFEFGKMKSFGVYVTSSASEEQAITPKYFYEPMAAVKEPTYEGITSVKLLLEAGFLYSKINKSEYAFLKNQIHKDALSFQEIHDNLEDQAEYKSRKSKLHQTLSKGWKVLL